jgi:hypothetical protein
LLDLTQSLLHLDKRAGPEFFLVVLEIRLGLDRAGGGVNLAIDELQFALEAAAVVRQRGRDRRAAGLEGVKGVRDIALGQAKGDGKTSGSKPAGGLSGVAKKNK